MKGWVRISVINWIFYSFRSSTMSFNVILFILVTSFITLSAAGSWRIRKDKIRIVARLQPPLVQIKNGTGHFYGNSVFKKL